MLHPLGKLSFLSAVALPACLVYKFTVLNAEYYMWSVAFGRGTSSIQRAARWPAGVWQGGGACANNLVRLDDDVVM